MKVYYALRTADWKIEDNGEANYYAMMADGRIKAFKSGPALPGYLQTTTWTVAHPTHYYRLIKLVFKGKVK